MTLPEKRSELLRLAVKDVRKSLRARTRGGNPKFKLDMNQWVNKGSKVCTVCMAGAVMMQTLELDVDRGKQAYPSDERISYDDADKLFEIDKMRVGAFRYLDLLASLGAEQLNALQKCAVLVAENFDGAKGHAPWSIYLKCADLLESVGL